MIRNIAVQDAPQTCPWRIDILSDFGGNRPGQLEASQGCGMHPM
jgi:hypothetical protein